MCVVRLSRLILRDCANLVELPDVLLNMDAPWEEIDLVGCDGILPPVIEGSNDVMQQLIGREKQRIKAHQFKVLVSNAGGKEVTYVGKPL